MKSIISHSSFVPVICGLIASVYLLFHGRPVNILEAATSPGFYIAFAVSASVALLLVYVVHTTDRYLNKKYDWRTATFERAMLQVLLGVITPALIDLVLLYVYFNILGQNIIDNGFLLIDYPIIICFILILNLYYLIYYFFTSETESTFLFNYEGHDYINVEIKDTTEKNYIVNQNGKEILLDHYDIFCFYRNAKHVILFTMHKEEYAIKEPLSTVTRQLSGGNFQQINRSIVLNLDTVKGYNIGKKRHTLELVFKEKYTGLVEHMGTYQFVVTKENIAVITDKLLQL